tara:strand:+ start:221 stop:1099 length:879 start_codon:yes stop_codon:yes gene_type:complete
MEQKLKDDNLSDMKSIFLFTFIIFCACSSQEEKVIEELKKKEWEREGWSLVWQDEFESNNLDLTKWSHEIGGHGFGNNELQYYTESDTNSFIRDGNLVIKANVLPQGISSSKGLRYYTSARLRTKEKGDWRFGRIDVKAKVALGQGIWPAIWMLPTDWAYGGWPSSGEIDIMEHVGHDPGGVHGSVHTEAYNHIMNTQRTAYKPLSNIDDSFYIYSIEWNVDKIDFFIDDIKYFTFKNDGSGNFRTWPFDQRFHLLINVAVGGDWPGSPDNSTKFPSEMLIDYVRVYEVSEE